MQDKEIDVLVGIVTHAPLGDIYRIRIFLFCYTQVHINPESIFREAQLVTSSKGKE